MQFFVDETRTPIEDASVEWKESDGFSFDPWHAVEDLRPLGNVTRARVAYRVSTGERKATAEPET
ncbi:MAG TPA: hypothetical protein VH560_04815 [Polyangia bacterium]|nr:hypothetical protein [Polyangia bacterium]